MKDQALGADGRFRRFLDHDRVRARAAQRTHLRLIAAEIVAPPFEAGAEAEGRAFDVPGAGDAMAAPPQVPALDAIETVEMRNHHARRADGEFGHALLGDARRRSPHIAGRLPRGIAQCLRAGLSPRRRLSTVCRPCPKECRPAAGGLRSMPQSAKDAVAPVELADVHHAVERQRGRIGHPFLGAEPIEEVLLAIGEPAGLLKELRLVVAQPGDLGGRPKRAQLHAGMILVIGRRNLLGEDLLILERAPAIPDDRIAQAASWRRREQ